MKKLTKMWKKFNQKWMVFLLLILVLGVIGFYYNQSFTVTSGEYTCVDPDENLDASIRQTTKTTYTPPTVTTTYTPPSTATSTPQPTSAVVSSVSKSNNYIFGVFALMIAVIGGLGYTIFFKKTKRRRK